VRLTLNNEQVEAAVTEYVRDMLAFMEDDSDLITVQSFTRHHGGRVSAVVQVQDQGEE